MDGEGVVILQKQEATQYDQLHLEKVQVKREPSHDTKQTSTELNGFDAKWIERFKELEVSTSVLSFDSHFEAKTLDTYSLPYCAYFHHFNRMLSTGIYLSTRSPQCSSKEREEPTIGQLGVASASSHAQMGRFGSSQ